MPPPSFRRPGTSAGSSPRARRSSPTAGARPSAGPRAPAFSAGGGTSWGRPSSAISRELQRDEPPVHLSERRATQGVLTVDPTGFRAGDELIVADRVRAVLT